MPTKEEWWSMLPSGSRGSFWERRYLDDIGKINPTDKSIVDAVGLLNMRWRPDMLGVQQWNPLEYHSFGYFRTHPCAGAGEINIESYLENGNGNGLDFYVYLCMDSLYVNYEMIRDNDQFVLHLPQACGIQESLKIQCTIDALPRKHQVVRHWDGSFVALALPVFLRLEAEDLNNISRLFERYSMNTLMFDLKYYYPLEQNFTLTDDLSHVIVEPVYSDDPLGTAMLRWPHFFTFGRPREEIRFLVASDIHVADRCDKIQQMGSSWLPESEGGPGPLSLEYCNYNKQADRLAKTALEKWQQGQIDYVVLVGDLVDFVLKDTIKAKVDIKPTEKFYEEPRPFGYGETAFNLESLILLPDSRPAFEPDENIQRIEEVLSKLSDLRNTNWEVFREIFRPMLSCVHTFLVPGNHDYLVFGSELAGMEPEEFDAFFGNEGAFGMYLAANTRDKIFATLLGVQPPGWVDMSTFSDMRITKNQAQEYDAGRLLKCGNPETNDFRALLGPFGSHKALFGLNRLQDDPDLRGADVRTAPISDFLIKCEGKDLRLAFLNSGPVWNQICNPSPWLCGFPNSKKGSNEAINELKKWRNNEAFQDDMLVLFMHAPPLSRRFPSAGINEYCYWFVLDDIEGISEDEKWPNSKYELTNIWRKPIAAQKTELANDPMFGAPFHNHEQLIRTLCPQEDITYSEFTSTQEKIRKTPVLTFAGHTHWRHTYALKRFIDDQTDRRRFRSRGWLDFDQGNKLLTLLNDSHDPAWWKLDGTGRSLIVTTGCIGPCPVGEFKIGGDGRLEYGDESDAGYTNPRDRQGFYTVTVKKSWGRVSNIVWNRMWYLDDV